MLLPRLFGVIRLYSGLSVVLDTLFLSLHIIRKQQRMAQGNLEIRDVGGGGETGINWG